MIGNFAHASPPLLFAARGTPSSTLTLGEPRGAERREARVLARHPGAPTWRARTLARRSGSLAIGTLTPRRSTGGFFAIPGRAFHAALAPRDQPAPGGWIVVPTRRCPGPPECEVTSLARGSRTSLRLQNVSGDAPR